MEGRWTCRSRDSLTVGAVSINGKKKWVQTSKKHALVKTSAMYGKHSSLHIFRME